MSSGCVVLPARLDPTHSSNAGPAKETIWGTCRLHPRLRKQLCLVDSRVDNLAQKSKQAPDQGMSCQQ